MTQVYKWIQIYNQMLMFISTYVKTFVLNFAIKSCAYTLLFVGLPTAFSCVSIKQQKYMQDQKADVHVQIKSPKTFPLMEPIYRLQPDDVISVEVFSLTQEKFNFLGSTPKLELKVDQQGNVELPVVGNIKVMGLTLQQTQDTIKSMTTDYLKSPKVSVKLINFSFTVLGEVSNQGTFEAEGTNLTVLEALGKAGGLTDYADRSHIKLLRHDSKAATMYYIDILEDNLLLTDKYFIQPNDVLVIDPIKGKNARSNVGNFTIALSILTAISVLVFRFQ